MFTEQKRGFDWFSLIVGILFILAGLASIMHPDKTLHFLAILVGIAFILRESTSYGSGSWLTGPLTKTQVGSSLQQF